MAPVSAFVPSDSLQVDGMLPAALMVEGIEGSATHKTVTVDKPDSPSPTDPFPLPHAAVLVLPADPARRLPVQLVQGGGA